MATLAQHTNNVLAEFGSVIPDNLLSFEDVMRKFVRVRALELQKLGISDTDKTVIEDTLEVTARSGAMPGKYIDASISILPAGVSLQPNASTNYREFVEIVPVEDIPSYEGENAISFYGEPMRYKMAADLWLRGTIYLLYDPVENWDVLINSTEVTFPPQFKILLEVKTALAVIDLIPLKLAVKQPNEFPDEQKAKITEALTIFAVNKGRELAEWEEQFKLWRNKDLNEGPRTRRTYDELKARNYRGINRGYW